MNIWQRFRALFGAQYIMVRSGDRYRVMHAYRRFGTYFVRDTGGRAALRKEWMAQTPQELIYGEPAAGRMLVDADGFSREKRWAPLTENVGATINMMPDLPKPERVEQPSSIGPAGYSVRGAAIGPAGYSVQGAAIGQNGLLEEAFKRQFENALLNGTPHVITNNKP